MVEYLGTSRHLVYIHNILDNQLVRRLSACEIRPEHGTSYCGT